MIFKTFESDIDKISAKWGIFGKSFNDFVEASRNRKIAIDVAIGGMSLKDAKKQAGSFWSYLYPSKESIQSQMIDVDALYPKIDTSKFDFNGWITELDTVDKQVKDNALSWQGYSNRLKNNEKWIAKWGQETQGQIRTQEGLVKANENARQAAIEHNKELEQQTLSAKAAELGLKALRVAGNMLAMWAISEVITGLYKLSQVSKDVAASASEMGSSFSSTKSDIEDYKQEVEELYETINDSSSSISEVTDARKQLMSIQDELIEKYGTEQSSIDAITKAIKGETSAWKELTETKWQELKNKFNDGGFINDVGNVFSGYKDNIQRMQKEYGEYTATIEFGSISGNDKRKQAEDLLKKFGVFSGTANGNGVGHIKLSGNATEVYNQLLKIQDLVNKSGIDFGTSFDSQLRYLANSAKSVSEQYKDTYNSFILNEKILKNSKDGYSDAFKKITEEYDKYQDAINSNDEEKVKSSTESFVKTITEEMDKAFVNGDSDVADYFRNMYPELQDEIDSWNFDVKFKTNTANLKDDVSGSLKKIGGLSKEKLVGFNLETATDEQKQGYGELQAIAEKYNLTIDELIDKLESLGLISSESYQKLVDKFGQEAVDSLSSEDLTYAYQIKNVGDMSFEELKTEIQKLKDETKNSDKSTISLTNTADQLNKKLHPALESLKSAYASIFEIEDGEIKFSLKNVDASMFTDLKDKLQEIVGEGATIDTSTYENFITVLSDTKSTSTQVQDAFNEMATSILDSSKSMTNLNDETKNLIISTLKSLGVTNAETVVTAKLQAEEAKLVYQKELASKTSEELANLSEDERQSLINLAGGTEIAKVELMKLIAQQTIFSNQDLSVTDKLKDLEKLAKGFGQTALAAELATKMADINTQNPLPDLGTTISSGQNNTFEILASKQKTLNALYEEYEEKVLNFNPFADIEFDGNTPNDKNSSSSSKSKSTLKTNDNYYNQYQAQVDDYKATIEKLTDDLDTINNKLEKAIETGNTELVNQLQVEADKKNTALRDYLASSAKSVREMAEKQILPIVYEIAPQLKGKKYSDITQKDLQAINKALEDAVIAEENAETTAKNNGNDDADNSAAIKSAEMRQKIFESLLDTLEDIDSVAGNANGSGEWAEKWADSLDKVISRIKELYDYQIGISDYNADLFEKQGNYSELEQLYVNKLSLIANQAKQLRELGYKDTSSDIQGLQGDYIDTQSKLLENKTKQFEEQIKANEKVVTSINDNIDDLNENDYTTKIELLNELLPAYNNKLATIEAQQKKLTDSFGGVANMTVETQEAMAELDEQALETAKNIKETQKLISEAIRAQYEYRQSLLDNENSNLENYYELLDLANNGEEKKSNLDSRINNLTISIQSAYREIDRLRAEDTQKNADAIQTEVQRVYDATKKILDLRKEQYQAEYDELNRYIEMRDTLENWLVGEKAKYIKKTEKLIKESYAKGLIDAKTYIEQLSDVYISEFEQYQSEQQRLQQAAIDAIEKEIEAIEKAQDAKVDALEEEIDLLEKRKEELEDQLELYDKAKSAVDTLIDEETERLQEEIDKLEEKNNQQTKAIELAEKQQALAKAQQQKSAYIYRENEGWVYESNAQELADAQQDLWEYQREQQFEAEKQAIQDRIDALNEYKESWQDAVDAYEKAQDKIAASAVIGKDWVTKLLR